ncbi:hypothetical protein [uncultured Clostridium sp.]|uniref:hypothetical protein n=1 Tax=uncultured Clostridium sp. TaxID=59620 RepID=UPI00260C8C9A|nr:hypothetical protein [uncultured Clostridium sp.]
MANLNQNYSVLDADVVTQLSGLGDNMGIDIAIAAPNGKAITVVNGATIELSWVDGNGAQTLAQVLVAGTIDGTSGPLLLGTYYPDGHVFADQAAVNAFFTTPISAKIYKATIA